MTADDVRILPSLLSADFSDLAGEIRSVEGKGVTELHLDVMDGTFVPNLTFGPIVIEAVRSLTTLVLDTHLMVREPAHLIPAFRRAGADWISIHVEACTDVGGALRAIRESGAKVGLAVNPETPLDAALPWLGELDHLLLMTVSPGFGGQSFRAEVLPKIEEAVRVREREGHSFRIEVDGGISPGTARDVAAAGARLLVAGSDVFGADDRAGAIAEIARRAVS